MICDTVLDAIGHTPLVRLHRMVSPGSAEVLVKFEALNVGGSIKTRTAYNMILEAEREGLLKPDSVIVATDHFRLWTSIPTKIFCPLKEILFLCIVVYI